MSSKSSAKAATKADPKPAAVKPAAAKPAAAAASAAAPAQPAAAKPAAAAPAQPAKAAPAADAKAASAKTTVPETLLKKRKTAAKTAEQKAAEAAQEKAKRAKARKDIFKRAEKYVQEYRTRERDEIRLRRQAKLAGNFYVPSEAKLAFVVRIRGINGVAPKTRKILQLLRLLQIHNGIFVKLNKATINMLRLVEPYLAYGYPNLKSVKELVYKRGFAKVNRQRIPLTDNKIIEEHLGKYGIICIEDIVHEIYTVGPHFKQVTNFLWPFKLSSPNGGFVKKRTHFIEGGDFGNREDKINDLIRRMN